MLFLRRQKPILLSIVGNWHWHSIGCHEREYNLSYEAITGQFGVIKPSIYWNQNIVVGLNSTFDSLFLEGNVWGQILIDC